MKTWLIVLGVVTAGGVATMLFVMRGSDEPKKPATATTGEARAAAKPSPGAPGAGSASPASPAGSGAGPAAGQQAAVPRAPLAPAAGAKTATNPASTKAENAPAAMAQPEPPAEGGRPFKIPLSQSPALTEMLNSPAHQAVASNARAVLEQTAPDRCDKAFGGAEKLAASIRAMGVTAQDSNAEPVPISARPGKGQDAADHYQQILARTVVNMERWPKAYKVLTTHNPKNSEYACGMFRGFVQDIRQDLPLQ